jgi:hypothetical protein
MSWFPVPPESELPDDLQGLFRKVREKLGFVPNVFVSYSFRPERLRSWFTHFKSLHEPTDHLSVADREMIAVVVSMATAASTAWSPTAPPCARRSATRSSATASRSTGSAPASTSAAPPSARTPRSSPARRAR